MCPSLKKNTDKQDGSRVDQRPSDRTHPNNRQPTLWNAAPDAQGHGCVERRKWKVSRHHKLCHSHSHCDVFCTGHATSASCHAKKPSARIAQSEHQYGCDVVVGSRRSRSNPVNGITAFKAPEQNIESKIKKNMSTFTSRSATHEIPRQFFSALKSHTFERLREFSAECAADWSSIMKAITEWDQRARDAEVALFKQTTPNADNLYQYSVLRTVKTLQHAEGGDNVKMRAKDLELIDLNSFFATFMSNIAQCPDVCSSKERFLKLSPTDRNLVSEDAFRSVLYAVARHIKSRLITNAAETRVPTGPVATSTDNEELIRADDSVSVAPSEAISEAPRSTSKLNAQILSLHNAASVAPKSRQASRQGSRQVSRLPSQRPRTTQKAIRVPAQFVTPVEDVASIHIDVPSSTTSRKKSKFSRSPPPTNDDNAPKFFDTEVSRGVRSVSTRYTTV